MFSLGEFTYKLYQHIYFRLRFDLANSINTYLRLKYMLYWEDFNLKYKS